MVDEVRRTRVGWLWCLVLALGCGKVAGSGLEEQGEEPGPDGIPSNPGGDYPGCGLYQPPSGAGSSYGGSSYGGSSYGGSSYGGSSYGGSSYGGSSYGGCTALGCVPGATFLASTPAWVEDAQTLRAEACRNQDCYIANVPVNGTNELTGHACCNSEQVFLTIDASFVQLNWSQPSFADEFANGDHYRLTLLGFANKRRITLIDDTVDYARLEVGCGQACSHVYVDQTHLPNQPEDDPGAGSYAGDNSGGAAGEAGAGGLPPSIE